MCFTTNSLPWRSSVPWDLKNILWTNTSAPSGSAPQTWTLISWGSGRRQPPSTSRVRTRSWTTLWMFYRWLRATELSCIKVLTTAWQVCQVPLLLKLYWNVYLRSGDETVQTRSQISLHLLSPLWSVRGGVMGWFPHPSRGCSGQDGHAYHSLPRANQHLQHRYHQLSQCWGDDRHWCLDVSLHLLRLRGLNRLFD